MPGIASLTNQHSSSPQLDLCGHPFALLPATLALGCVHCQLCCCCSNCIPPAAAQLQPAQRRLFQEGIWQARRSSWNAGCGMGPAYRGAGIGLCMPTGVRTWKAWAPGGFLLLAVACAWLCLLRCVIARHCTRLRSRNSATNPAQPRRQQALPKPAAAEFDVGLNYKLNADPAKSATAYVCVL